ncbi:MAG: hypothetical protein H7A34_01985 [bacterium]|nr:hypothetical protein [bacterium]
MRIDLRTNTAVVCSPSIQGLLYLEMFVRSNTRPQMVFTYGNWNPDIFLEQYPRSFWNEYIDYFDIRKPLDYYKDDCEMTFCPIPNKSALPSLISQCPADYFIVTDETKELLPLLNSGKHFIYAGKNISYSSDTTISATAYAVQGNAIHSPLKTSFFKKPEIPDNHKKFFFELIFTQWVCAQTLYALLTENMDDKDII